MVVARFCGTALTLQGHAGAAPHGQDLVCAAVSALAYALAERIRELDAQGAFEEPPVIRLASGRAQIAAPATKEVAEDFRLIECGLRLLQAHYPKQVKVQTEAEKYEM